MDLILDLKLAQSLTIANMNLLLRPLNDVNDVTWSIVISLIILLAGVGYYIAYIMSMAFDELKDGDSERSSNEDN